MSDFDIRLTRTIHAPAQRVWATLTQAELVSRWMMGAKVESTWAKGASIKWSGEYRGKQFTDKGKVLEVEKAKYLKHSHFSAMSGQEDVPENYHCLSWKLVERDGETKLTLIQSGARSQTQADEFKKNWSQMLDQLKETAEAA